MAEAKNQPAVRETSNGTVMMTHDQAVAVMGQFKDYLATRAEPTADVATALAADQLAIIMNTDDEAAMWAADELAMEAGKDIYDREQEILSYSVHESSDRFKAPLGHYIIVQAVRMDTGEQFTWNTGSPLVIGKIRWLEAHGKLPKQVVIRSIETPNGARLRLMPVVRRAEQTTTA